MERAENLFAATLDASHPGRIRMVEAIRILAGDGGLAGQPTWANLFNMLTAERAAELAALYDALPDGARAEYEQRYGRPADV